MWWNHSVRMFSSRSVSRHATGSWNRQSGVNDGSRVLVVCAIGRLEVDGAAVDGHRRLHDRLAERRVRMDVPAELPRVALEQLRQRRLGDELGRAVADDMGPEQLAGLGVGDDLDESAGLAVDLGAAD